MGKPATSRRLAGDSRIFLAAVLAAVAVFLADPPAAAQAEMKWASDTVIEVSGQTAGKPWRLVYGVDPQMRAIKEFNPLLVNVASGRAYLATACWLRQIDTAKGVVTGRWFFPGIIERIELAGGKLRLQVADFFRINQPVRRTIEFDPAAPTVPYWPPNFLQVYRYSMAEAEYAHHAAILGWVVGAPRIDAEDAKRLIPLVEDMAKRDPLSPWFQIRLGKLLRDTDDARAHAVFAAAVATPNASFSEMFRISPFLERWGERELGRQAYERGLADFLAKGNDPRLFNVLTGRLFLYAPLPATGEPVDPAYRRELVERMYTLAPAAEGAAFAWEAYSKHFEQQRNAQEARLWHERAEEAKRTFTLFGAFASHSLDFGTLGIFCAGLAALLYIVALYFRYRPAARFAAAAGEVRPRATGRQLSSFAALVLLAWLVAFVVVPVKTSGGPEPHAMITFVLAVVAAGALSLFLNSVLPERHAALFPRPFRRGFTLFNVEYWNRNERLAFLAIVLIGWVSVGLMVGLIQGVLRAASAPVSAGMGKFAGPVLDQWLRDNLPASPERDFAVAMREQNDGEYATAEAAYRRLPQFPQSWNNLGVLLEQTGRKSEARTAYEEALRRDPSLAESKLNLGRDADTFWTKLHQKYAPGVPMLAPPTGEMMERALLGGSRTQLCLLALAGPFAGTPASRMPLPWGTHQIQVTDAGTFVVPVVGLAVALAILFLVPSRLVTQPLRAFHTVWQLLFPGTSPAWRMLGGVVLFLWTFLVVQDVLLFWKGTPYIVMFIGIPNLERAYGVIGDFSALRLRRIGGPINPSAFSVFVLPALVFAVNALVVWRARRRQPQPAQ